MHDEIDDEEELIAAYEDEGVTFPPEADSWDLETIHNYAEDELAEEDDGEGEDGEGGEDTPEGSSGSSMAEGVQLGIESEIPIVGNNETQISVNGIEIPGAYEYRRSGDGFESSYLEETEVGSGGDTDYDGTGGDSGDEAPQGGQNVAAAGSSEGGEVPPETITISAWIGYNTLQELRDMRTLDDQFPVNVEGETLENMELSDLELEHTGENPYIVHAQIEVREWREYEVEDPLGDSGTDYSQGDGSGSGDPSEDVSDLPESGTPDDPNEITVPEGETERIVLGDGDRLRNVDIDATEPGADVEIIPTGDNWEISDVSIDGGDENTPAIRIEGDAEDEDGEPAGTIENVLIDGEEFEADGGQYDVVTVSAGSREVVHLGDGDTLENVLYDLTASGSGLTIAAYGTNWTIRNVGVRGQVDMGDECIIGCSDTGGGTSVIENVYLGDGAVHEQKGGTGVWVRPDHSGTIEFSNVYIEGMHDNSLYCSAPGSGGDVHIDRCFSKNCWVAHYRLARGSVTNSVAVNDTSRSYSTGRGVWAWSPGPVEVRNCHLAMNGHHYSIRAGANGGSSTVNVYNTQYDTGFNGGMREASGSTINLVEGNGTSPQEYIPDGCPTTPEQAASGTGSDGTSPPPDEPVEYDEGVFQWFDGRDPDGDSYVRDGPEYTGPEPAPGIYINPDRVHGDIDISRVHVRNVSGGGLYASNPHPDSGAVNISDSYFHGNEGDSVTLGSIGADDSTTVTVEEGEHETVTLDPGERIENVMVDCTAPETAVTFVAHEGDWSIINVGILGEMDHPDATHALECSVESGSTGIVEKFYLGDGTGSEMSGINVTDAHAGDLYIRDSMFQEWHDFAIDAAPVADAGPVTITDCHFEGNVRDHVHIGTESTAVRRCVFVHTSDEYGDAGRGVAVHYNDTADQVQIDSCDFTWVSGGTGIASINGATALAVDCRFEDAPVDEEIEQS